MYRSSVSATFLSVSLNKHWFSQFIDYVPVSEAFRTLFMLTMSLIHPIFSSFGCFTFAKIMPSYVFLTGYLQYVCNFARRQARPISCICALIVNSQDIERC